MAVVGSITRLHDEQLDKILCYLFDITGGTGIQSTVTESSTVSTILSSRTNRDVASFRQVNRRFNRIYKLRLTKCNRLMEPLPSRALDSILDSLLGTLLIDANVQDPKLQELPVNNNRQKQVFPRYQNLRPSDLAKLLSPGAYEDVLNFRAVSKRFNGKFARRFGRGVNIWDLPSEIHDIILDYLVNYSTDGQLIPIAKKTSLSVESFTLLVPQQIDTTTIANYRLVCRQFAQRALRCQFTRVWIRFSNDGFERLRFVAERPHLAEVVKQFSYMIPRFYFQENAIFDELTRRTKAMMLSLRTEISEREKTSQKTQRPTFTQLQSRLARIEENEKVITRTIAKAKEQHQIVSQKRDFESLCFALNAFSNLEQIRFMKVMDQVDTGWMNVIEMYPEFRERLNAEWNLACEHSAKTLTEALILSNARNFQRLSSRFMDPSTPISLTEGSSGVISQVAKRLKSLELEFDNRWNLDEKIKELSALFRLVLAEAQGLENLHIGFRRLVSVPIGTIFHDVELEHLSYLGVHQWELDSQELIDLLIRYRHIKYLRLRYVRLRRGSWAKVLKTIRLNMNLNWISLRGISYHGNSPHILGLQPALGHGPEESDPDSDSVSWTGSESDDSDDELSSEEDDSDDDQIEEHSEIEDDESHSSEDGDDEEEDGSDDEGSILGQGVHIGSLPNVTNPPISDAQFDSPPINGNSNNNNNTATTNNNSTSYRHVRRASHAGQCQCFNGYAWDKLDDNRETIQESQWKRWQKWALKPCRLHDSEAARLESDSSESESEDEGVEIG